MVQAWYQGGVSVFDFTDSAKPVEIAFFDRGPLDAKKLITGGYWSSYWYNGYIYGTEIARGIDVFRLTPSEHLSQNEIDAAAARPGDRVQRAAAAAGHLAGELRGRARVSRSARRAARESSRTVPVRSRPPSSALTGCVRGATMAPPPVLEQLDALATQLERDAASAGAQDAVRLRALASHTQGTAAGLR